MKLIWVFLITFLFFSCSSNNGNFSVQAPESWTVIDSVSKTRGKIIQMHPPRLDINHPFVESISISIVEFASVDIYVNNVTSDAMKSYYFFEKKNKGSTKINKYDALWVQHIVQLTKKEPIVEQKVYFIGEHGNIYIIVCTYKPNEINRFQPTIDRVLSTFKIL